MIIVIHNNSSKDDKYVLSSIADYLNGSGYADYSGLNIYKEGHHYYVDNKTERKENK